jgi:lipid A 3-O-deacylase
MRRPHEVLMIKDSLVLFVFVILFTPVATQASETQQAQDKIVLGWLHAIRLGVLAHDMDDLWSGTRKEGGVDLNTEIIFSRPNFSLLSGNIRPNLGASINTQGDTSKVYGGILWELETKSGVFLNLGIGAAIHNGKIETNQEDKKSLGSRVLFRIPIEIGYRLDEHHHFSVLFDHVSNGFLADSNEGLDTLGLRYGYQF